MEMDGSRRLIREWETSGMDEDGSGCGGEAGLHRQDALIEFLRQKETRLKRMAQFLAVALLLLFLVALALLVTVVQGGRGHQSPDNQALKHSTCKPSVISDKQQQQQKDYKNPSAMLTVTKDNNIHGEYLGWESEVGHAFCHGGFNYSEGNLVVPRTGMYRVFLQITYESKNGLQCPSDVLRLTNMVLRYQDSYPVNVHLLSSVDTVNCSMEPWSKSLYTAGMFLLEANSRLRVTSSHRELIVEKEYQVFFGAELLSQS